MLKYFGIVIAMLVTAATSAYASNVTQTARSIEDFKFIRTETALNQVTGKLGAPDKDIGSGIHIYVYRLHDNTNVFIGSDGKNIAYVKHGTDIEHSIDISPEKN